METILIIEDDPTMLRGLKDNFEFEGYRVQTATDGDLGLKAALKIKPDLIVLDLMLPKINGYEICGFLREVPATLTMVQTPILGVFAVGRAVRQPTRRPVMNLTE